MFSVYIYDKTFDGLLTAVFDAYFRKTFPRCFVVGRRCFAFIL